MIVYNVGRQWFTEKALAEKARIAQGLKPSATIKLMVNSRESLAMLLNALCDARPSTPLIDRIVETAFVPPHVEVTDDVVPDFLMREHREREARMAKLYVNKGSR